MTEAASEGVVSHRAALTHERVMAASIAAQSRPLPSIWWKILALLAALAIAIWLGHLNAFYLVQAMPFNWMFRLGPYMPIIVPAMLCLAAVLIVEAAFQWIARRAYLKAFDRVAIPRGIDATYEILPEGLKLSTSRITIFPKWEVIDTVEEVGDGWAISADHLTFFIPHDSFPGPETEREFMRALIAPLGELARSRSPFAVAFAEAGTSHSA